MGVKIKQWLLSAGIITTVLGNGAVAATDKPLAPVKVMAAHFQSVAQSIKGFGEILPDPAGQQALAVSYASVIDKVYVKPGMAVTKGQQLLTLHPSPDEQKSLSQSRSDYTFARHYWQRMVKLRQQGSISANQLDVAKQGVENAKAALHAQRQKIQAAAKGLLRAPVSGTIVSVAARSGDRLAAEQPLVQVVPSKKRYAVIGVSADGIEAIKVGQSCQITTVFPPRHQFTGKVALVGQMRDSNTGLTPVYIPLPPDSSFNINQQVTAVIQVGQQHGVMLPLDAIWDDQQGNYVFTAKQGKAHKVYVQRGAQQGHQVLVMSGIKDNDQVIVQGNYQLSEGDAINITGQEH